MQWSDDRNAGFSTARRDELVRGVVCSGPFSSRHVNVDDQRRDEGSLLRWMQRALRSRRACPEFGDGDCRVLEDGDPAVLATHHRLGDGAVLALHNLSGRSVEAAPELPGLADAEPVGPRRGEPPRLDADGAARVPLGPYGYRWLRLS